MDVIAQAQSGTGKTATFSIAILEKIDTGLRECQALILAPTRELAQQIQKVVMSLGDYMGAQCHACIGGTSVRGDMGKLDQVCVSSLYIKLPVFSESVVIHNKNFCHSEVPVCPIVSL